MDANETNDVAAPLPNNTLAAKQPGGTGYAEALERRQTAGRKVNKKQRVMQADGTVKEFTVKSIDPETESKHAE